MRWDAIPRQGDDFTAGEEVIDPAGRTRLTTVTWGIEVVRTWNGQGGWQRVRGRAGELCAEGRLACQRVFEERALQLGFAKQEQFPPGHTYRFDRSSLSFTRVEEDGKRVEVRADFSDVRPLGDSSIPWVSVYSRDGTPVVEVRVSSAEWIDPSEDAFVPPPADRCIEGDDVCVCCGGRPLESTKLGEVPVDSLRDPETQVAALFPSADRYATRLMSFLRKGGEEGWRGAENDMGGAWDKETEGLRVVYPFYAAYAGDRLLGYALCSSSPGTHGKVQLAVALDLEGDLLAAQVQAMNSPEASRLLAPGFVAGLLNGASAAPANASRDEAALARCLLKARVLYAHLLGR